MGKLRPKYKYGPGHRGCPLCPLRRPPFQGGRGQTLPALGHHPHHQGGSHCPAAAACGVLGQSGPLLLGLGALAARDMAQQEKQLVLGMKHLLSWRSMTMRSPTHTWLHVGPFPEGCRPQQGHQGPTPLQATLCGASSRRECWAAWWVGGGEMEGGSGVGGVLGRGEGNGLREGEQE